MARTAAIAPSPADALDLVYPSGFYAYQAPYAMDFVAAIGGYAPRAPERPFIYLDIGCGDGFTITLLAAVNPHGRFIGIDLNPAHVAIAQQRIAAMGLENVVVVTADVAEWRALDLPPLDYIAMHGVWAWIAETTRADIVALAAARLRPGGVLYAGYNTTPGWAAAAPLRAFLIARAERGSGHLVDRLAEGLSQLKRLRDKGAEYFARNPVAGGLLEEWTTRDVRYVAHEIFAPHWSPQSFADVAKAMAGADLVYAGSVDLERNFPRASVRPELQPFLLAESDRVRQELVRDIAYNTYFRRDIFVRAEGERHPAAACLDEIVIGARVPDRDLGTEIATPGGKFPLTAPVLMALRQALRGGARRFGELAQRLAGAGFSADEVANAVQLLAIGRHVGPFREPTTPVDAAPREWRLTLALNRDLLRNPPVGDDAYALVLAPPTGSAIALDPIDAAVLLSVDEAGRAEAPAWSWRHLSQRQRWLKLKGAPQRERSQHVTLFDKALKAMDERLKKYVELGLIAPR